MNLKRIISYITFFIIISQGFYIYYGSYKEIHDKCIINCQNMKTKCKVFIHRQLLDNLKWLLNPEERSFIYLSPIHNLHYKARIENQDIMNKIEEGKEIDCIIDPDDLLFPIKLYCNCNNFYLIFLIFIYCLISISFIFYNLIKNFIYLICKIY
jgi:hypothetical protein